MPVSPGYTTTPPWDSDKWPHSNWKKKALPTYNGWMGPGVGMMDGLVCLDVSISPDQQSVVFAKNSMEIHVEIGNITCIDTLGNIMTINTEDEVPYYVAFVSREHLSLVENRLFLAMNGVPDPGCGVENTGGDFAPDFSGDFN